jgi:hypothetical protein
MKEWGRELYTSCCELNKRNATAEIWKLRGLRQEIEIGKCPYVRRKRINHTYI